MIIDCFPFFNELDLLEIRLHELSDVVDLFVITEATLTHSGKPKPLYFDDNKERFSDFNIEHVILEDFSNINTSHSWAIEGYQRQYGIDHIKKIGFAPDDVVLISDCDEIFRSDKVRESANTNGWTCAGAFMWMFYYYMNCFYTNEAWFPARWIKVGSLDDWDIRGGKWDALFLDAGWHFSYFGDIKEKLSAFAHTEHNRYPYNTDEYIESRKSECKNFLGDKGKFVIMQDLSYLPKYVLENKDRFSEYIK